MIAVTLGLGEEHNFYANEAAKRMTKHTGLRTHVLDDAVYNEYRSHPVFQLKDYGVSEIYYLKSFVFDIFPTEEDILYFDCDYCVLRKFNPYHFGSALTVVRDRTCDIQNEEHLSTGMHYFNAGFFIANRGHHADLLRQVRERAKDYRRHWQDQCVMNQLVVDNRIQVNYLPRIYNCLDTGPALLDSNPFAIHSSVNYQHYRAGTQIETTDNLEWDLTEMNFQAGLNVVHGADKPYSSILLRDGTDWKGNIWFISRGKHYICDIGGRGLKEVEFSKLNH